jgi:hypothetical protein
MFRVPGMSRQPQGILASGPQIMDAAMRSTDQSPIMQVSTDPVVQVPRTRSRETVKENFKNFTDMLSPIGEALAAGSGVGRDIVERRRMERAQLAADEMVQKTLAMQDADPTDPDESMYGSDYEYDAKVYGPARYDGMNPDESMYSSGDAGAPFDLGAAINETNKKVIDKNPTDNKSKVDDMMSMQVDAAAKLRSNLENIYKGVDFDKNVTEASQNLTTRISDLQETMNKENEELTLADIDADFENLMGYKPGDIKTEAEQERKTSFWLGLMKAGLAIAAGESSNALTNIAKGLSFGLDQYGKDMQRISSQERQDLKEQASLRYSLLKDKKSEQIAQRALDVQYKSALYSIAQEQDKRAREDKKQFVDTQFALGKLDIALYQTANELGIKLGDQKISQEKLDLMSSELELKYTLDPKLAASAYAAGGLIPRVEGQEIVITDPTTWQLNPEWVDIAKKAFLDNSPTRSTAADKEASAAGRRLVVKGVQYPTAEAAEDAQRASALSFTGVTNIYDRAMMQLDEAQRMKGKLIDTNAIEILRDEAKKNPDSALAKRLKKAGIKLDSDVFDFTEIVDVN